MLQWLEQAQKGKPGSKAAGHGVISRTTSSFRLQYMGKLGPNEFLLRLAKDSAPDTPAEFSSELGLTTREGEVLSWLAKGKTNRDIAQILGSARDGGQASRADLRQARGRETAPPRPRSRPAQAGAIRNLDHSTSERTVFQATGSITCGGGHQSVALPDISSPAERHHFLVRGDHWQHINGQIVSPVPGPCVHDNIVDRGA